MNSYVNEINQNSQTTLKMKNKIGGLTLHDFKTYYNATVIKIMQY